MPKRRLVSLAVLLIAFAAPAQASATTETASSGQVSATFTYAKTADGNFKNLHLSIQRGGVVARDQAVESEDCGAYCWPGSAGLDSSSLTVRDLDGDAEPEVVLALYTGGAHCCVVVQVFALNSAAGAAPTYAVAEHNFGDAGYELTDIEGDGTPEFQSADYRFAYSLASYAGSGMPVQIWRYRAGALVDVTREYPALIRADSKDHWKTYRKYIRKTSPYNDPGLGALAAWAGNEYLLGHGAKVQRELRSALARRWLNGGFTRGRATIRTLNKLLSDAGYR
jgi:hypothetical protein